VSTTSPERQIAQATALTMVAGMADAVGYITMGGVFAANMTGNTVLAGIAVGTRNYTDAWHHFLPLVAFFLGGMLSRCLQRLARTPTAPLIVEALLLATIGFLKIDPEAAVLVVAVAMGLQASASAPFCTGAVSTVVVTSTLTRAADAVLDRLWLGAKSDPPVVAADLRLLSLVWAGYLLGAIAGALVIPVLPYPLLLPAALLVIVLLV
jgi:uncharacterized membrane protein YoaK (UPF0700 family)